VAFSFNDSTILAFPFEGLTTKWYSRSRCGSVPSRSPDELDRGGVHRGAVCLVLGTLAAFGLTRLVPRSRCVGGLVGAPLVLPGDRRDRGADGLRESQHDLSLKTSPRNDLHVPVGDRHRGSAVVRFQRVQEEAAITCSRLEVLRHHPSAHRAGARRRRIFAFTWSFNN
jgi:hypothetical protein